MYILLISYGICSLLLTVTWLQSTLCAVEPVMQQAVTNTKWIIGNAQAQFKISQFRGIEYASAICAGVVVSDRVFHSDNPRLVLTAWHGMACTTHLLPFVSVCPSVVPLRVCDDLLFLCTMYIQRVCGMRVVVQGGNAG